MRRAEASDHYGGPAVDDDVDHLERTIARIRGILRAGRWPTGLPISPDERASLDWHLELAQGERAERRRRARA